MTIGKNSIYTVFKKWLQLKKRMDGNKLAHIFKENKYVFLWGQALNVCIKN